MFKQKRIILTLEVPEIIVSSLGLRDCIVWLRLSGVYNIGELQGVLNEEDGNIVSVNALAVIPQTIFFDMHGADIPNNVPITLFCVEFDCETSDISNSIGTSATTQDGGET